MKLSLFPCRLPVAMAAVALAASSAPGATAGAVVPVNRRCIIANTDCFAVKAGFKSLTPEDRVGRLNDRLAYILGYENLTPGNVHVVRRREYGDIYVGRSHLFTATPGDARANGMGSTVQLAERWAAKLKRVLPQGMKGSNRDVPLRYPRLGADASLVR